jgi:chemotaxis protein histidine kinase CheA
MSTQYAMQEFLRELKDFTTTAEAALQRIEADMEGNQPLFELFARRMLAVRGTADQLGLRRASQIAGLAEEIAIKAQTAATRPQIRKCIGSLWDAITTLHHLLAHPEEGGAGQAEEIEQILLKRLHATLGAFGGARAKVSQDEIEALLKGRSGS